MRGGRGVRPGGRAGGGGGQGHRAPAVGRARRRASSWAMPIACSRCCGTCFFNAVKFTPRGGRVARRRRARRQPGPGHRERHRARHLRGVPAPRLRALPPGRGLEQPDPARARPGAHARARAGRAARRNGPRGERRQGPGRHLHGRPSHPGHPARADADDRQPAVASERPARDASGLQRATARICSTASSLLVVDDEADARDALVGRPGAVRRGRAPRRLRWPRPWPPWRRTCPTC